MTNTPNPTGDKPVVTQPVDGGFDAASVEAAELAWACLPTGRKWASLATHEKALVIHTLARHREQDTLSREGREAPWPGCFADLQRRRVTTLAKLGLMLSIMAGGEAAEVVGYDAADLYAEVLMALAIEDADDTDIALEEARDHPDGDILAALSTAPASPEQADANDL